MLNFSYVQMSGSEERESKIGFYIPFSKLCCVSEYLIPTYSEFSTQRLGAGISSDLCF